MNIELDLEDALIEEAKAFLPPHTSLQEVIEHCLKLNRQNAAARHR